MNEVAFLTGITVTENRALIKKFEKLTKTKSGIILPEEDHKAPDGGTIVAIGPGVVDGPKLIAKLGDKVRYLEQGKIVLIDNEEYYLIRTTDIWAFID